MNYTYTNTGKSVDCLLGYLPPFSKQRFELILRYIEYFTYKLVLK